MKRDIEFMAINNNGELVYGQYYSEKYVHYIRSKGKRKTVIDHIIDHETLCQSTDLIDVKNVKIFEFDILEHVKTKRKFVVLYYRGAFRLMDFDEFKRYGDGYNSVYGVDYGNSNSDISKSFRQNSHTYFKVVGNIYEKEE